MNVLALCAGIGGLELGLHLAEPRANPVVFVEQNEFCRSVLAARWPGVPIWDDVTTFDGRTWAGRIDVITGGFPCQPWSVAGKRLGLLDPRWIWPDIARIVREVGPRFVFLENTPGLITGGGLPLVLGSLAEERFTVAWSRYECKGLGASHLRKRVAILAYRPFEQLQGEEWRGLPGPVQGGGGLGVVSTVADPVRQQFRGQQVPGRERSVSAITEFDRPPLEYPNRLGRGGNGLPDPRDAQAKGPSFGVWAPGRDAEWQLLPRELWPAEPSPTKQPVRGVADGIPARLELSRRARISALGNAYSPIVSAAAWTDLKGRLMTASI